MDKRLWIGAVLFGALVTPAVMRAGIVYDVNQTVGVGGVTGFIETDGVFGTLATGDILDWNLTLTDASGTTSLFGPLSGGGSTFFVSGDDLTATPTLLQFNFNADGSFMNFFLTSNCAQTEWSLETTGSGTGCNGTTGNEQGVSAVGEPVFAAESGEVTIGTAGVPEPSAFGLTLVALLGVALAARKGAAQFPARRVPR